MMEEKEVGRQNSEFRSQETRVRSRNTDCSLVDYNSCIVTTLVNPLPIHNS